MQFSGSLFQGERPIAQGVSGDYNVTLYGGRPGWQGTMIAPRGTALPVGGPFLLKLDDGREVQIVITRSGFNGAMFTAADAPP